MRGHYLGFVVGQAAAQLRPLGRSAVGLTHRVITLPAGVAAYSAVFLE